MSKRKRNDLAIFDLDNTLCVLKSRQIWEFNKLSTDVINLNLFAKYKLFKDDGFKIFILTARPSKYKRATKEWLAKAGIEYDKLFMKSIIYSGMSGIDYKIEILRKCALDFDYVISFDDYPKINEFCRSVGIEVGK